MQKFNPMNLFKKQTPEDKTRAVIQTAETLRELDDLQNLAQNMLKDERYQKFRKDFEDVFGKALRELLGYRHQDNDIYAVNVRTLIQQLNDLLAFLNTPVEFLNHVELKRFDLLEKAKITETGAGKPA